MGIEPFEVGSEMYRMMECFTQMWTDFAKTGYVFSYLANLLSNISFAWRSIQMPNTHVYYNDRSIGDSSEMYNYRDDNFANE